jgi:hypothetical protein
VAESIGSNAFVGCTSLADLTLGSTPPTVSGIMFYSTTGGGVNTITIHVPDPGAYSSAGWPGVGTAVTDYNFYGASSKMVLITTN